MMPEEAPRVAHLQPHKEQHMAKVLYTAEAHVTGGRAEGHGKTSDGNLEVDLRLPKEMGGQGDGTNPEELFAVGFAACFEGALGAVSRRIKQELGDVAIDSKVSLLPTAERGFKLAVELDVTLPGVTDAEQAKEVVAAAHQVCPYSNATRGNIEVALTANGEPVAA
jgi:osmotically inducible protein OsmC